MMALNVTAFSLLASSLAAQSLEDIRAQGREMLTLVRKDLEKNYFDPKFGGVDLRGVLAKAEQSMQAAQSAGHSFGIIAQALTALNDRHTFFIPPSRVSKVHYGWRMMMVGDRCIVTAVRPGSDAEAKGVRPGDEIGAIEGFRPVRDNLWKMRLMYYSLQPRPALKLALRSPDGQERIVEPVATVKTGKQLVDLAGSTAQFDYYEILREAQSEAQVDPHAYKTFGKNLMIYRMPDFDIEASQLDDVFKKAHDCSGLILDLRHNGGGAVATLERVAGHLLGKGVLLAERRGRKQEKPIRSQSLGTPPVEAKLVVLVDSDSASGSEILARAVQLEKRGTVIGDRTAGAVRQSRQYSEQLGVDRVVLFGVSVTTADLVMKDGKSLEHVGVVPDELALPQPADLAAGRDVVLARAAELLGVKVSPEDAGRMFPVKWIN